MPKFELDGFALKMNEHSFILTGESPRVKYNSTPAVLSAIEKACFAAYWKQAAPFFGKPGIFVQAHIIDFSVLQCYTRRERFE